MNEDYDVIILGTGLKECILSGLLSVSGKKVLHLDRNDYYGGEGASLNLNQLYRKFKPNETPDEATLGLSKYYCADLCPKFIMACGNLVKMLLHTKVTRYLEFKSMSGCYVYKDDAIHKVPATPAEAVASSLMGFMQKHRFKSFLQMVSGYNQADPSTHQGRNAAECTTADLYNYWKLDDNTQAFTGHAIALHTNDDYLQQSALDTVEKIQLYAYSVSRYGNSPFIYPIYGLGGLPEGFSRLAAIHGGTFMLNRPVQEVLYDEQGKARGIRSNGEEARAPLIIGDPSYFLDTKKVVKTGKVARWLFILDHPIDGTSGADSCQIIIPFKHTGRKNDIYVSCVSHAHNVAAQGKYLAMISSVVETSDSKRELGHAVRLLGRTLADFFFESDMYSPTGDGTNDRVFIPKSFDPTSHFQQDAVNVIEIYERITGTKLDLSISAEPSDLQDQ
ncbi:Rab GDP dissociation inhibitor [Plasmodiophora brassicae]